jgi:triacylglycerol lipase
MQQPSSPARLLLSRRVFTSLSLSTALLRRHAAHAATDDPPILFVHGNQDYAAVFTTMIWRFESNGWDRSRLFTIDFARPAALLDYTQPDSNRSTPDDEMQELAAQVAKVLHSTGNDKLVLIAHSRGGNIVRHYIKNGGGAANVSIAILAGTPNHGGRGRASDANYREFYTEGAFLRQLNDGGTEAVAGIRWLTLRSDSGDIFFQPTRIRWGHAEEPSGLRYDSPELTGATNTVLPGRTHNELVADPAAFREMYQFITGHEPVRLDIVPEAEPVLDGKIMQMAGDTELNTPFVGAVVVVYEVSQATGERLSPAVHEKTTGADGVWGPFRAKSDAFHEFVVSCSGYPVNNIYCPPFPRSCSVVHIRPRALADEDRKAGSVIILTIESGNFALDHGSTLIDGAPTPDLKPMPRTSEESTLRLAPGSPRAVPVVRNDDHFAVRNWQIADNHLVIARLHS